MSAKDPGPAPKTPAPRSPGAGARRFEGIKTQEAFFADIREDLRQLSGGSPPPGEATVSFQSLSALVSVLTPKRAALVDALLARGSFPSVKALAASLHRHPSSVGKDVSALAEVGLIRVEKTTSPAGRRCVRVFPAAVDLEIQLKARVQG